MEEGEEEEGEEEEKKEARLVFLISLHEESRGRLHLQLPAPG